MEYALQACIEGSAMALVLLAVRPFVKQRISYRALLVLWVIVLARFLYLAELPFPWLETSINTYATSVTSAASTVSVEPASPVGTMAGTAGVAGAASASSVAAPTNLLDATRNAVRTTTSALAASPIPWSSVWMAGTGAFLTCVIALYTIQAYELRDTRRPSDRPELDRWLDGHRLARGLRVLESNAVRTPVARGTLRPHIIVPAGYLDGHWDGIAAALEHEYVHLRRFDPLVRTLYLIACCLFWFNPVAWFARRLFCHDQELACDESALRRLGERARMAYATALLDSAQATVAARTIGVGVGFGADRRAPLTERIVSIVQPKTVGRTTAIAIGAAILLGMFAVCAGAAAISPTSSQVRVGIGTCSIALPPYWDGRVEVVYKENAVIVALADHPNHQLVKLVKTDPIADEITDKTVLMGPVLITHMIENPIRTESSGYRRLWSGQDANGDTYELWGLCYADMSRGDAWRTAFTSNPTYQGEDFEREAVDLSTGGAVTVEELLPLSPYGYEDVDESWFDFYREQIVPTVRFS